MAAAESPIDWRRAEQIATRIAGRHADRESIAADHTTRDINLSLMIPRLEDQIEATTGLRSMAGPADVEVIDRPAWIRANIASFQHLLAPLIDQWAEKMPMKGMAARISGQLVGAELGAQLALEEHCVALGVSPDPVLGAAERAPPVKHIELGSVQVDRGGVVLVAEGPAPMWVSLEMGSGPGANLLTDSSADQEFHLRCVGAGLPCVGQVGLPRTVSPGSAVKNLHERR